jgi:acetolactate synthase-1/2/3 large subunit
MDSVLAHGVDTVFGIPGGQTYELFDALYARGDTIRLITTRSEQGAAYMAFGYARSTGKVGVYTTVPGPGVFNSGAALTTAYACNAPVLCLTGQVPSAAIGRGIGYLHDVPDQLGVLQRMTKWAARIEHPSHAPAMVCEAFRQLTTGRRRPVSLEMALDVMSQEAEVEMLPPEQHREPLVAESRDVERAAALLAGAERPMIYLGSGAVEAGEEIRALAELLQAPVVAQRGGRGYEIVEPLGGHQREQARGHGIGHAAGRELRQCRLPRLPPKLVDRGKRDAPLRLADTDCRECGDDEPPV